MPTTREMVTHPLVLETAIGVTCGGGGYGDPWKRDVEQVRHDVAECWISRERAKNVYGVVINGDGAVDDAATRALRDRVA